MTAELDPMTQSNGGFQIHMISVKMQFEPKILEIRPEAYIT